MLLFELQPAHGQPNLRYILIGFKAKGLPLNELETSHSQLSLLSCEKISIRVSGCCWCKKPCLQ